MSQPEHLLLDTSIVIHWFRGKEVAQRIDEAFGLRARADKPLISVVTVGEALGLGKQRSWGERKIEALRAASRARRRRHQQQGDPGPILRYSGHG